MLMARRAMLSSVASVRPSIRLAAKRLRHVTTGGPRDPQSLGDGEVRHTARCQQHDRDAHRVAPGGFSSPRSPA